MLAAVEAASPVAAVDVLAAALAEAVGAREVSFLIAVIVVIGGLVYVVWSAGCGRRGPQGPPAHLAACSLESLDR